ncbi:protein of unknown function DUF4203 [Phytophthora cactorum]|nr:protein of unknown function DUF4203 [Phytophthora cactorum]
MGGILALKLEKPVLIATTAIVGATICVWGVGYFAGDYPNGADLKQFRAQNDKGDWVYNIPDAWWDIWLTTVYALGFLGGGVVIAVIFEKVFKDETWVLTASWIAFVVGGIIVGYICVYVYWAGVCMGGAVAGASLAILVNTSFGYKFAPSHPATVLIYHTLDRRYRDEEDMLPRHRGGMTPARVQYANMDTPAVQTPYQQPFNQQRYPTSNQVQWEDLQNQHPTHQNTNQSQPQSYTDTSLVQPHVAAGVAISNSSPLFVYCLSVCFLNEHLNLNKILGVLTAFVGVILIVIFQDGSGFGTIEATTIVAGISMIISSAIYAGYQVALQLAIGEDITDTSTLLTLAGLCGLFTFPPWILGTFLLAESPLTWLHESLALPGTAEGVFLLAISGVLTVIFCAFLP